MNYPITIAASLTLLAFAAHVTGGLRQTLSIAPSKFAGSHIERRELDILDRNWVQVMCAFQLISVDLLVLAGVLYLLAFTDTLSPKQPIALALAAIYFLWGCSWVLQLFEACTKRIPVPGPLGILVSMRRPHFLGRPVHVKLIQRRRGTFTVQGVACLGCTPYLHMAD